MPGDPEASRLVLAVRYGDPDLRMPPSGRLPAGMIAAFETWVGAGAPDPREAAPRPQPADRIDPEEAAEPEPLWSLQPILDPPIPAVFDTDWSRTAIDRFVLARLEREGLPPAADADPTVRVRRLSYALIGLPPDTETVQRFARDPSAGAWARLVDRYLASPRFGERWGRHWLDVARFAESTGGGRSQLFENAWRYRDRVIRAFNGETPFDRFIGAQVAGDLLPGNVSGFVERPLPGYEKLEAAHEAHSRRLAAARKGVEDARKALDELRKRLTREALVGLVIDDTEATLVGEWTRSTHHPRFVGADYLHHGNQGKGEKLVRFPLEVRRGQASTRYALPTRRARTAPGTLR